MKSNERPTAAKPYMLALMAFALSMLVNVLQIAGAQWGIGLLPAFSQSDAFFYLHKAWFTAFVDPTGGELDRVIPLSPYVTLLSWAYRMFGDSAAVPFVVNAVLVALAATLTALTTRRMFGQMAGWIAAGLVALYGPIVFFAGLAVKTSLELALLAGCLYCAVRGLRGSIGWLVPAAATGALLAIERNNMAVLLIALAVIALIAIQGRGRKALAVVLLATSTLVVALGVSWQPTTLEQRFFSPVGLNFHVGNAPGSRGAYTHIKDIRNDLVGHHTTAVTVAERHEARSLSRSEVSAYWFERSWRFIASDPGAYALLQLRKLQLLVSQHVPGAPEEYRVWRTARPALLVAFVDYGFLLAFFAIGLWAHRARLREPAFGFTLLTLAMYMASLWVFFIIERYRLPAAILMTPIAAAGVEFTIRTAREREWRPTIAVMVGYALTMLLSAGIVTQPGWVQDIAAARANELKRHATLAASFETKRQVAAGAEWPQWAALSRDLFQRGLRSDARITIERAIATSPHEPETYWVAFSLATRSKDKERLAELGQRARAIALQLPAEQRRRFEDLHAEVERRLAPRPAGS